jgi:hypothetical protein
MPSATRTVSELWVPTEIRPEVGLQTPPWPVFEGDVDAMWDEGTDAFRARDLGPIMIKAAEQLIGDEVARGLIWSGFKARRVLHEGTFGDRRTLWAVSTDDVRTRKPPFPTVYAYGLSNSPYNMPAVAAYRADTFTRQGWPSSLRQYTLNDSIPNLDQATAALFVFRSHDLEAARQVV